MDPAIEEARQHKGQNNACRPCGLPRHSVCECPPAHRCIWPWGRDMNRHYSLSSEFGSNCCGRASRLRYRSKSGSTTG